MRLKHRLMPVLGFGFLLALVSNVRAQSDVHPADRLFQSHGGSIVSPLTVAANDESPVVIRANNGIAGFPYEETQPGMPPGMPPGYAPVNSHPPGVAGVPPGSQPWPGISPFDNRYSEHFNKDGLWMHKNNNSPRRYFAGIYAVLFDLKNPERRVLGDPRATLFQGNAAFNIGGQSPDGSPSAFRDYFHSQGLRLQWGFMDPDDTGLELVSWWAADTHNGYHEFEGNLPIALNDQAGGQIITFTQVFHLVYRQVGANFQATRLMRPIWEPMDAVKLRPMWGGRYLFLRERLAMAGVTDTFGAELRNTSYTSLFGPSAGLRGEIGGDLFKIIVGGQFLLLANWDHQKLRGYNMLPDDYNPGTIYQFRDDRQQFHLSTGFEITAHLEADLINLIPLVNRFWLLRNATIRGGLTYLTVGQIARPGRTTNWNAYKPSLNTHRSTFDLFAYDIGLVFRY